MLSYSQTDYLVAVLDRERRTNPSAALMPQMYVLNHAIPLTLDFNISAIEQYFLFSVQDGVNNFVTGKATFPIDSRGDFYLCSIGVASWDALNPPNTLVHKTPLRVQITDGRTGWRIWDDAQQLPPGRATLGIYADPERLPIPYPFLAGGELVVDITMNRAESPGTVSDLNDTWSIGLMGVQLVQTP